MSNRTKYTDTQRDEALTLVEQIGQAATSRQLGIPLGTIKAWAGRGDIKGPNPDAVYKANAASIAARKTALAEGLLDDIERLRQRMFTTHTERKPMVVSHGRNEGSSIEIARVDHDQPTPTDQRLLMTAVAIAVDKLQILTGDATTRTEHIGTGTGDSNDVDTRRDAALAIVKDINAA